MSTPNVIICQASIFYKHEDFHIFSSILQYCIDNNKYDVSIKSLTFCFDYIIIKKVLYVYICRPILINTAAN